MGAEPAWLAKARRGWDKIYEDYGLRYCIPFILLLAYTAAGAMVLFFVEGHRENEDRTEYKERIEFARSQVMRRLVEIKWDPEIDDPEAVYNRTLDALDWYNDITDLQAHMNLRLGPPLWTWWGAMFFCGTIYSTIGYGQPSPVTPIGRFFTCIYALVGIPLFLVILKEVGIHLSRLLRRTWNHGSRSLAKLKLKYAKPVTTDPEKGCGEEGKKSTKRRSRLPFPWYFPLILVGAWIAFSGGLFCLWEPNWGFATSTYFVFMSLSTIGLGDVVPSKPDLMLANFALLLIGLALISMSFSVIQIRIEELLEDMLQNFMEDFERLGDNKFEIGLHGAPAALSSLCLPPALISVSKFCLEAEGSGKKPSVQKWMRGQLVTALVPRRSPTLHDSDEEEETTSRHPSTANQPPLHSALQKWAASKGTSGVLLSRLIKPGQMARAEAVVARCTTAAQTTGDFQDILHFLDIPHHSAAVSMRDTESQTDFRLDVEDPPYISLASSLPASILQLPSVSKHTRLSARTRIGNALKAEGSRSGTVTPQAPGRLDIELLALDNLAAQPYPNPSPLSRSPLLAPRASPEYPSLPLPCPSQSPPPTQPSPSSLPTPPTPVATPTPTLRFSKTEDSAAEEFRSLLSSIRLPDSSIQPSSSSLTENEEMASLPD